MKKSNIFAYVELSKLVGSLQNQASTLKDQLKSQAAYFNIIEGRFFSEELAKDWEAIVSTVKRAAVPAGEASRLSLGQIAGTIEEMSDKDCQLLAKRLTVLYQKLEAELNQ